MVWVGCGFATLRRHVRVAPPALFFVYLIVATAVYLALVEVTKSIFYHFVGSVQRPVAPMVGTDRMPKRRPL
ncbi:MAG: hypothetical protein JWM91_2333 [Rhodospirillales bacterium]|nr:hypothetical protein [Rhodospirillales bacterium]